jgi:Amt family ammonium transporter
MSRDKVDPDEMMLHMNNDLFLTKTGGMFVTCILGEYNIITDEIRWVNGGHQPAVIRDEKGNYQKFESKSPPMGVISQKNKSVYSINKMKLNGHRFYAFTDGLSESETEQGEEIGIEGSIDIIEKNFNLDAKKQLSDITKKIIKASGDNNLSDDLTLISIGK